MKWILIITLIVIIMVIAVSVSRQYRQKFEFYSNMKTFLERYKVNVSFKQEKIYDILSAHDGNIQFAPFISAYRDYLKSGDLNFSTIKVLDSEEITEIEGIVKSLGNYDQKNELAQIESFSLTIASRLKKAEEDKMKICPMILKLSFLFAVGVAILLI